MRVGCVLFPRRSALRPVAEFALDAALALAERGLLLELLLPLPLGPLRALSSWSGRASWPPGLEDRLRRLALPARLIPYAPLPRRSVEAAAWALAAHLIARPRWDRPQVLLGSFLDEGGYAAAQAGHAAGLPAAVVAHGSDVRALLGELPDPGRRRRARQAIQSAAQVVAVSHQLAGGLARLGVRAAIIPFTARAASFPLAPPPPRARRLLFVGRVERAKGVDLLLAALAALPEVRLELVGPATGDLPLEQELARLGLATRVTVTGELPPSALPAAYARSDLLVLPSRAEGLPCVLVEALLSGRPVVAAAVGGVPELVRGGAGRLVPPEDPAALARAIALELEERRDPAALRRLALPFAWESSGERLAALLETLACS